MIETLRGRDDERLGRAATQHSRFPTPDHDSIDDLTSNRLRTIGSLLVSIFAGRFMPNRLMDANLEAFAPLS